MWCVAVSGRRSARLGGCVWVGVGAASRALSRRRLLAISAVVRNRRRVIEVELAFIGLVGGGSGVVRRCVWEGWLCLRFWVGVGAVSRVPAGSRRLLARSAAIRGRLRVLEVGLAAIEAVGGCSGSGAAVCVGRPLVGEV